MSFKDKKIFDSIEQTIGNTPLVKLKNIKSKLGFYGEIIAKLEFFNPLGSVKDRIGLAMINEAEKSKKINSNTTIIEPTSGNTGIALAFVCAARNYKLTLTMPNSMSLERRNVSVPWGKYRFNSKRTWYDGAIQKQKKYIKTNNSVILDQFSNKANPDIHYKTTAAEIWSSLDGIDSFISGIGRGTISEQESF